MRRREVIGGLLLAAAGWRADAQSQLGVAAPVPITPLPSLQAPKGDDTVGPGFSRSVIARWGDAVLPDAPAFNPDPLTAQQADTQFPYDAIIAAAVAPPAAQDGIPRLVLVFANPAAPATMVFPGGIDNADVAGRLQGATVMNLQFQGGRWVTVDGGYQSRRLTDGTLCQISGPAAAAAGVTVQGVLAPQAGCATPWGNVLLGEGDAAPWLAQLADVGLGFGDPAEAARFGWVVELNPLDPGSFPTKRTALGRFARSGLVATRTADGRPVVFMSQDDPAGMVFRFIAATAATDGTALDSGTLAVAVIQDNYVSWLDLPGDTAGLVGALGAAQTAGGSPFDAPGGLALGPDGTLYLACGGNLARAAGATNALNPRAGDDNGHVLALRPAGGDPTAKRFAGEIAIAAGNPVTTPLTQYTQGSVAWFTKPRTLNIDPLGQLWIGTDQNGAVSATADGMFVMQTGGPSQYLIDIAYLAPLGAAMGGAAFDPTSHAGFAVVRHPGATPAASFDAPATRWPTLLPNMPPQTTVIGLMSS